MESLGSSKGWESRCAPATLSLAVALLFRARFNSSFLASKDLRLAIAYASSNCSSKESPAGNCRSACIAMIRFASVSLPANFLAFSAIMPWFSWFWANTLSL